MSKSNRLILSAIFLLAAAGFLLPFWPLEALAVILAALLGHPLFAISLGLLLDVAYGAPTGLMQYAFFPFTILAGVSVIIKKVGVKYLLGRRPPEHL